MNNPMNELWKAQQDAAAQIAGSWRTVLQPPAGRTAPPPDPAEADDPETAVTDSAGTDEFDAPEEVAEPEPGFSASDVFRAIAALADGQRDFADHMARWADLQRDLADTLTDWAGEQREHADALHHLLAPFSSGATPAGTVDQPE